MTALEIITVLIILVIVTQIILKSRKNNIEKDISASQAKVQDKAPQQPKPTANTEPTITSQTPDTSISAAQEHEPEAIIEPATKSHAVAIEVSTTENNSLLPQDSTLRRHYLTHLCTMIESLAPLRPTDAVLCRHYDAMLAAKLQHCSTDQKILDQLFYDYENNKPIAIAESLTQPQVEVSEIATTEDNSNPLPQDSVLRRHYLAHLTSMIESLASRPTDSVLIRHYEAILAANLVQCLTNKDAMKQLFEDYESLK